MNQENNKKQEAQPIPQISNPEKRFLGKKAEEYLREAGKIEDYPNESLKQDE